jgi:hypothetical protein
VSPKRYVRFDLPLGLEGEVLAARLTEQIGERCTFAWQESRTAGARWGELRCAVLDERVGLQWVGQQLVIDADDDYWLAQLEVALPALGATSESRWPYPAALRRPWRELGFHRRMLRASKGAGTRRILFRWTFPLLFPLYLVLEIGAVLFLVSAGFVARRLAARRGSSEKYR